MSPVYWVYLVMLFNAMRGFSRFRLWRIDAAREKLKARIHELTGPGFGREQKRADPPDQVLAEAEARATTRDIMEQLSELRARCQRYMGSVVTPMGDEMFYRYQESLIDELTAALAAVSTPANTGDQPPAFPSAPDGQIGAGFRRQPQL
jgi:hypothetical protein